MANSSNEGVLLAGREPIQHVYIDMRDKVKERVELMSQDRPFGKYEEHIVHYVSTKLGMSVADLYSLSHDERRSILNVIHLTMDALHDSFQLDDNNKSITGKKSAAPTEGNDTSFILMGAENHNGWKLEELLAKLQDEVAFKTSKIINKEDIVAKLVAENNIKIAVLLGEAEALQRLSNKVLDYSKGPNQGPSGKSRI